MKKLASALLLGGLAALAATSAQAFAITATFKNETGVHGGSAPGTITKTSCFRYDGGSCPVFSSTGITNTFGGTEVVSFNYPAPNPSLSYEQADFQVTYQAAAGQSCIFFFRISKNSLQQWGYNNATATPVSGAECAFTTINVTPSTGTSNITFVFRK